jgi:hypothetical protein
MKLWLVERVDDVGWDECAGFVIAAAEPARALETAQNEEPNGGKWKIALIGTAAAGVSGVVLRDFRAG